MAYTLKFTKGGKRLDLMTGRYITDFVPPDVAIRPLIAEGTSANKTGGGSLIDTSASNRSITFTVHVRGLSDHEVARGVSDLRRWLGMAGDESEPLYLQYHPNDSIAREPLWGQRSIYYEIVFADSIQLTETYGMSNIRTRQADCQVTVTVKPYAVGKRQRLSAALGGVLEDNIGASDGFSRGLIVPEVTPTGGNYFTNPVYGHSTWNTSWTAGSAIDASQNTDKEFTLIPGSLSSAKVTSRSTTNNSWTQSLTVTATTYALSCYVKLIDGTAPTSSDMQLFYNNTGSLTTTFAAVGDDGTYRATATFTGVATPQATGVVVKQFRTVFVSGFQCERLAYSTALCYGDLLGCAWSGTSHNSTSTRTAGGRVRLTISSDTFVKSQGTVRMVVKWAYANTHANNLFLWSCASTGLRAYFQASDDKIYLTDGTNTASTAAQTFAAGDVMVLHFTYLPGTGLVIYKAGASAASVGTYTTPTDANLGSYLYIGSDDTPAQQFNGVIMDFTVWDYALTSTEVSNDYTNIVQVASDGERVTAVPYLWTKDGDDIIDNCNDSTRDNFFVACGIPGSNAADTEYQIAYDNANTPTIYLALLDFRRMFFPPDDGFVYGEFSGTATSNIDSGSAYQATSVSTTAVDFSLTGGIYGYSELANRPIMMVARLYDEGSNLTGASKVTLSSAGKSITTEFVALTTSAAMRFVVLPELVFPDVRVLIGDNGNFSRTLTYSAALSLKRSSGTANVRMDYSMVLVRPVAKLTVSVAGPSSFILRGKRYFDYITSTNLLVLSNQVQGDAVDLFPERPNMMIGVTSDNPMVVADTLTFTKVFVKPRYELL